MDTRLLLDAPGQATSRIQIAAIGSYKHKQYGDFDITTDEVHDWQKNLGVLPGGRALIDLDHRADRRPRNSEAAGWITGIELDGDKVWGNVEWTDIGKSAIESKRYLFFSPSYGMFEDETGTTTPNTLFGGALTNKPHLSRMATVSLASPERVEMAGEQYVYGDLYLLDVDADERKLALKEGNSLPDGSYPTRNTAQLHAAAHLAASGHGDAAAAKKLIQRRAKELGVDVKSLPGFGAQSADSRRAMATVTETALKLLDLPEDADDAAVEAAITKALDAATATPAEDTKTLEAEVAVKDAKIVTLEGQMQELRTFADTIKAENEERAFNDIFSKAVREGRTTDAQRDNFRKFYTLDSEGTAKMLAEAPQLVRMTPSGWDNSRDNPDAQELPANVGDKPGQIGEDSFQLDSRIRAHIAASDKLSLETDYTRIANDFMNGRLR